jgi:hypothetical protein
VRESETGCPLILEFHTECRIREVTCDQKNVKNLNEIIYRHHEYAIHSIPSMNVSFVVTVTIKYIQVVEFGFDILSPRKGIIIAESSIPLLRVSPWILDPY